MGGAKVSDKIGVLKALMEKADTILICGAMANTFFKAQGIPIGASRVEADKLDLANELLALAKEKGVKLVLPADAIIAQEVKTGVPSRESGTLTPEHDRTGENPSQVSEHFQETDHPAFYRSRTRPLWGFFSIRSHQ